MDMTGSEEPLDGSQDESLDERVELVLDDLDDVDRTRSDDGVTYLVRGRVFAALAEDVLEVALDPSIAAAALNTPHATASTRGSGWVRFAPPTLDRFALDRAEAWLRSAYARAARSR
jgi:hypothetical protein